MNAQDRAPQNRAPQIRSPVWGRSQKAALAGLLLVQSAAAYFIGAGRWLTNDGHYLVAPIVGTAVFPVALFLAAYALSARFRGFVLSQDLRTLTMMQHWDAALGCSTGASSDSCFCGFTQSALGTPARERLTANRLIAVGKFTPGS